MLSLCKLVINHNGWIIGMVKYQKNASGMAIWAKNVFFAKNKSLDFSEKMKIAQNRSKMGRHGLACTDL